MASVLIVDDSPVDAKLLSEIVERAGYQVVIAVNAEQGIALAIQSKPDVILMDVIMPGMNGFQATRYLSQNPKTSHIPVIIVTTKGMETDRVWGMRQGAKDFMIKPVQEADLKARIQKLLYGESI